MMTKMTSVALMACASLAAAFPLSGTPADAQPKQVDCPSSFVLYVCGTFEIGFGALGEKFKSELASMVEGAEIQALDYNTAPEYAETVAEGAATAAKVLTDKVQQCPEVELALVGYSKGAIVAHETSVSQDVQDQVAAIAVFGDPNAMEGNMAFPINSDKDTISFCNEGDPFCAGGSDIGAHLAYVNDGSAEKAAQFVASRL